MVQYRVIVALHYYNIHLTTFFQDNLGKLVPER